MEHAVADFQVDVIEASKEKPVLVDFWAPWCGPCRVLGPVLDTLAAQDEDRWTLVKVNTDEHPELSMQYGIRGIPAVKLFVDGHVAAEFTGALPEYAVQQWLDENLPSESKRLTGAASAALLEGDEARAQTLLEKALASDPENARARVLLAGRLLFDDPDRAETLLGSGAFAGADMVQQEEAIRTLARLLRRDPADLPEGKSREEYAAALEALKQQDFDGALEGFINVVRADRAYDDDGARKAAVALFILLGPPHEATRRWRRTFDMALY